MSYFWYQRWNGLLIIKKLKHFSTRRLGSHILLLDYVPWLYNCEWTLSASHVSAGCSFVSPSSIRWQRVAAHCFLCHPRTAALRRIAQGRTATSFFHTCPLTLPKIRLCTREKYRVSLFWPDKRLRRRHTALLSANFSPYQKIGKSFVHVILPIAPFVHDRLL